LKGIVCIIVEEGYGSILKFVEIVSQGLDKTKAKVEVP